MSTKTKDIIIRSLKELNAYSSKEPVKATALFLPASKDLVCNNLFCEKVTGPCICRLERVLERFSVAHLKKIDLSGNRLTDLPPSLEKFKHSIEKLDISNNDLEKSRLPRYLNDIKDLKV